MCLDTLSAPKLIAMAFYSLIKCSPRIPAQLPFVSPLSKCSVECAKDKAARSDVPVLFHSGLSFLNSRTKWNECLLPKHECVCCMCTYATNVCFCQKERNGSTHLINIEIHSFPLDKSKCFWTIFSPVYSLQACMSFQRPSI